MVGWTKIYDEGSIQCFRKPNEFSEFDTLKADGIVNKAPENVAHCLYQNWAQLNRELDDENLEQFDLIEKITD